MTSINGLTSTSNGHDFHELNYPQPTPVVHFLDAELKGRKLRYHRRFSMGYRHMIRFFTLGIWDELKAAGRYEFMLRLGEAYPRAAFGWVRLP